MAAISNILCQMGGGGGGGGGGGMSKSPNNSPLSLVLGVWNEKAILGNRGLQIFCKCQI